MDASKVIRITNAANDVLINHIFVDIAKNAELGHYEFYYDGQIAPDARRRLTDLGYRVGDSFMSPTEDKIITRISW